MVTIMATCRILADSLAVIEVTTADFAGETKGC
jgi:hypothetical protein